MLWLHREIRFWFWYLFQSAVFMAVYAVAYHYDWQHANGYDHGIAVPFICFVAAYAATWLLARLIGLVQRYRYAMAPRSIKKNRQPRRSSSDPRHAFLLERRHLTG